MIDKAVDLLLLIKGPQRFRQILSIVIVVVAVFFAWEARTGVMLDAYLSYRMTTLATLREKLMASQPAGNPKVIKLDADMRAIVDHRSRIQQMKVRERLWFLLRPFAGGASLWIGLGIVLAAVVSRVRVEGANSREGAITCLQIGGWLGIFCGLLGLLFNHEANKMFTFFWFPLLAAFALVVITNVARVLAGPSAEADEKPSQSPTSQPSEKKGSK